mmetsp:Transcript_530/g.705  ORF Transcript_530/g.705 Transcript_530/m.705 type:complete len:202 (-) Transcript_530:399-1004(-)
MEVAIILSLYHVLSCPTPKDGTQYHFIHEPWVQICFHLFASISLFIFLGPIATVLLVLFSIPSESSSFFVKLNGTSFGWRSKGFSVLPSQPSAPSGRAGRELSSAVKFSDVVEFMFIANAFFFMACILSLICFSSSSFAYPTQFRRLLSRSIDVEVSAGTFGSRLSDLKSFHFASLCVWRIQRILSTNFFVILSTLCSIFP